MFEVGESDLDEAVRDYKRVLAAMIDKRPSGTRQRIADAIGKHRSFVTQIIGDSYATVLPARHVGPILAVCHASPAEREAFLVAYQRAHPGRLPGTEPRGSGMRHVLLSVPDLGDAEDNEAFERALSEFAQRMAKIFEKR